MVGLQKVAAGTVTAWPAIHQSIIHLTPWACRFHLPAVSKTSPRRRTQCKLDQEFMRIGDGGGKAIREQSPMHKEGHREEEEREESKDEEGMGHESTGTRISTVTSPPFGNAILHTVGRDSLLDSKNNQQMVSNHRNPFQSPSKSIESQAFLSPSSHPLNPSSHIHTLLWLRPLFTALVLLSISPLCACVFLRGEKKTTWEEWEERKWWEVDTGIWISCGSTSGWNGEVIDNN